MKNYIVRLTDQQRHALHALVTTGKAAAYQIRHAHMLLKADVTGAAWTDAQIAQSFSAHVNTVAAVRRRFVEQGLEAALNRKPQQRLSRQPVLDGAAEARLIAVRCSEPPAGRARWTLRLLADRVVELNIVDTISHETVRTALKKNRLKAPLAPALGHSSRAKR